MCRAYFSVAKMAKDFGMSSPTTTCRVVTMKKPTATQMGYTVASGKPQDSSGASRTADTAGSPNQPMAREASVMPSWQADR